MKKTALLMLGAVLAFGISGCHFNRGVKGNGLRRAEQRNLPSFKAVDTTGAYEVEITCQKPASFEIEADENILPLIKTEVRDGVLFVSTEKRYDTRNPVVLRITVPELNAVSSSGAGDIKIRDVNGSDLRIESTGAASINAAGKAKNATISSTGAGDVEAAGLIAEKAKVSVTGAASVNVYVTDQLDVSVSGVGSVNYSGHPKTVNKNVSGIGSISEKSD